jgi:hypothetical protein
MSAGVVVAPIFPPAACLFGPDLGAFATSWIALAGGEYWDDSSEREFHRET